MYPSLQLTMSKDLPGFDKEGVIGFGAGVFFIGYFLLEIPGTLSSKNGVRASGLAGS